ncbi:SDR family oxidoreductase [Photobacterium angustum]|uniref:Clavaldehyde dehydrogenase n=1 Tax=Photobacterium angustum TaxID=661 RepID=A0A2S7VWQ2_PHOAN|nr:SDR family oxidoreductase [Photobacterium angustum]PQJ66268.1 clavaldehyde dehydrogenase [Photobacterium angustum]
MKNILITGGNSDIAKSLFKRLSKDYNIDAPIRNVLDVTSIDSVDSFVSNKSYDVLINCAGTLYSSLISKSDPSLWINDINVNLIGSYLVSRKVLINNPRAIVINIASTAAYNTYSDWSSYCASKAAVLSYSGCLYKDGYNVYILCPGAIDTKIRNGLDINNDNVMTIDQAISPIEDILNNKYNIGDIIFYRKNELLVKSFESC